MRHKSDRAGGAKFRKLRIAFSMTCAIACVLLVVLWVRSYSRLDTISGSGRGANSLSIIKGRLFINAGGFTFTSDAPTIGGMTHSTRKLLAGGRIVISSTSDISGFNYLPRGNGWKLPMWLMVAVSVVFSALPWLPWWSTRFSLRTLLIAITLVAVILGVVVWAAK